MVRLSAFAGALAVFLVTALLVSVVAGGLGPRLEFDAQRLLEQARAASPYDLKLPASLPEGYELENVIWGGADPKEFSDSTDFFVDIWYSNSHGDVIHVWQSNVVDLGPYDPTADADAVAEFVGDATWMFTAPRADGTDRYQLARRFAGGIIVTIDSVSEARLRDMAASVK